MRNCLVGPNCAKPIETLNCLWIEEKLVLKLLDFQLPYAFRSFRKVIYLTVTVLLGEDCALVPNRLVAETVNWYCLPVDKPVTVTAVADPR